MSEKQPDELIGKRLGGQYEILDEIGRGGMATVYRASQISIKRPVAIKVLPQHFLHDPTFFERFEREVDVIAHLEHPHILPIYDYGKDHNVPFIVMRYLGGGSVADMIRRGVPKLETLETPFNQVAQALDHAHRQGVIHRDLKPGNIMLDENGNAYLSDFGIARVLGSNLTGSSQIIGTPAYMSPEQANGFPLDSRSDIYSLGIVLFEMITGQEPFHAETPMAILLKHINEPMPPLINYREDIPDAVERVISKATSKDPNNRYPSATDMALDFKEAIRHTTMAMRPARKAFEDSPTIAPDSGALGKSAAPARQTPSAAVFSPATAIPAPVTEGTSSTAAQPARRSSLPLILGGLALLAVIAIIAVVVITGGGGEAPVINVTATAGVPTPFAAAQKIETLYYSVSVPDDWTQQENVNRAGGESIHGWRDEDSQAYVVLTMQRADLTEDEAYTAAVDDYTSQRFAAGDNSEFSFIDMEVAADGTVRQSYRRVGSALPPGQVDVFYLQRSSYLVVLEMYSPDTTGSELVPTFQNILDSLTVK
jgi:serine/threonine protein kinase